MHRTEVGIDLTRMECKVDRHTTMPGLHYGYRFNQNGM